MKKEIIVIVMVVGAFALGFLTAAGPIPDCPEPVVTRADQTEALRLVSTIRDDVHELIDSIDVLNDYIDSWMAHMDIFGYIYPCSGMVSIAAVESCVDPVTNTWGGASTDPTYEDWSITDTLYYIFDYVRWDSLQARGL